MYLLFVISVICFLMAFCKLFTAPVIWGLFKFNAKSLNLFLQVIQFLARDSREVRRLKQEVASLKAVLSKTSMRENYTEYVKTERKIVNLELSIQKQNDQKTLKNFLIKYGVNYGTQIILGLVLIVIAFFYRRHAVIIFSDRYDFSPFGSIISFPAKIENSVSVPFWIFVNNYSLRHIAGYLVK